MSGKAMFYLFGAMGTMMFMGMLPYINVLATLIARTH